MESLFFLNQQGFYLLRFLVGGCIGLALEFGVVVGGLVVFPVEVESVEILDVVGEVVLSLVFLVFECFLQLF